MKNKTSSQHSKTSDERIRLSVMAIGLALLLSLSTVTTVLAAEVVSKRTEKEHSEKGIKIQKIIQKVRIKKSDIIAATPEEHRDKLKDLPEVIELDVVTVKEGERSITYGNALADYLWVVYYEIDEDVTIDVDQLSPKPLPPSTPQGPPSSSASSLQLTHTP